jgi:hypothetical protein
MKYQLVLKRIYSHIHQCYYCLELDLSATSIMPGLFNQTNPDSLVTAPPKKHSHKKTSRNKDLAHKLSEKRNKNESKTVINTAVVTSIEPSPVDTKAVDDWIVVKENKKNKRSSSPVIATSITPKLFPKQQQQQRLHSNKATLSGKKTTANIKTAKKSVPKANTHTNTQTCTSLEKKNASHHQAWSNIVSQDIQTIKYQDISEDVPCLSDSESIAGSIESPCLSTRGLIHEEEDDKPNYYSPFSTGFDFGVSVPIVVEKSRSYTPGRLDKCLLSQRWTHSVENKTCSNHTKSILNLLNQADQVETSITHNSFRYFDEMMMSNSLYKYKSTVAEQDDEWMRNRQNWNSIASSFVR